MKTLKSSASLLCAVAVIGCADSESTNCRHSVCDIQDASCVEFVAEVIACQREVPVVQPEVRFVTSDELLAEREPPTPEQLEFERDYWAGEALVGLMPENYDPADAGSDSLDGFLAFYSWDTKEITILSDANIDDEEQAYRVLVHEMLHAQQDAEYDLEALWSEFATSFPRSLGVRAALEGEAVLYTNLADLEMLDLSPDEVDWGGYFYDWQNDMLTLARNSETPSLDVTGLFPYAFGGELVYRAWDARGWTGTRSFVLTPPDSAREVMGRLRGGASSPNLDAELAPHAVPVLPGHTYLGGGGQDAWLLNTMLQRRAGSVDLWNTGATRIDADHLSVWRDEQTGDRVAIWRLVGDTDVVRSLLTGVSSSWIEDPALATDLHVRAEGDDWVLIATEADNAVQVAEAITGWQSQEDAFDVAGQARKPTARRLVSHGLHEG